MNFKKILISIYFLHSARLSGELLTIYFCRTDLFPPQGANTPGNWNLDTFIYWPWRYIAIDLTGQLEPEEITLIDYDGDGTVQLKLALVALIMLTFIDHDADSMLQLILLDF